jgi:hypothetical protein
MSIESPRQSPAGSGIPRTPAFAVPRPPGATMGPPTEPEKPKRSHYSTEYPAKLHFNASQQAADSLKRLSGRRGFRLREVDHLRFALDMYLRANDPQYVRECDGS